MLSEFFYLYQNKKTSCFLPGTTLNQVLGDYYFNDTLSTLIFEAIRSIEISIRTVIANICSVSLGSFCHQDRKNYPNLSTQRYNRLYKDLRSAYERNKKQYSYTEHFAKKYGDKHEIPPFWIMIELISFGNLYPLFIGVENKIQADIVAIYQIPIKVFENWLKALRNIRNACAHHDRIWNIHVKPILIPRKNKYPLWHQNIEVPNDKIFTVLTIIYYLLGIIDKGKQKFWKKKLFLLLQEDNEVHSVSMGFVNGWKDSRLWS